MTYVELKNNLADVVNGLPLQTLAILADQNLGFVIEEIAEPFGLTMGEIGWICELVRQVITKERAVEEFEAGLKEKLVDDEDDLPRVGEIVAAINEKIFVKLLPALGMKALPVVALPPKNLPTGDVDVQFEEDSSLQNFPTSQLPNSSSAQTPPRSVPLNKILPKPAPPIPPLPRFPNLSNVAPVLNLKPFANSSSSQTSKLPNFQTSARDEQGQLLTKPPIMETSSEVMSENQTDSFLKMLAGKLDEKDLQTRFDKLPFALKTALRSIDSAKKVLDIGRKYGLHVDKLGVVAEETGLVILGMTHPNQFLPRLNRRLGIGEEKTRPIAQEINTEIFLKIREALKQVNGEEPSYQSFVPKTAVPKPVQPVVQEDYHPYKTLEPPQKPQTIVPQQKVVAPAGEETLDRDKILQEIENPSPMEINPKSEAPNPKQTQNNENAGGEKPQVTIQSPASKPSIAEFKPQPTEQIPEGVSYVPPTPVAPKPVETPRPAAQSIIDQKLSAPTAATKSESKYSADPYREPLG